MDRVSLIDEEIREAAVQRVFVGSQDEVECLGSYLLIRIMNNGRCTNGVHVDPYAVTLAARHRRYDGCYLSNGWATVPVGDKHKCGVKKSLNGF